MIEGSLSRRYSKAFFELAQEQKQEEAIGQEIEQFLATYTNSPLPTVLNNPAFGMESRESAHDDALGPCHGNNDNLSQVGVS